MLIVIYVAHVDDDVILAGGTIAKLAKDNKVVVVYANNGIVVHGRPGLNLRQEAYKAASILGVEDIHFLNIPTMEFERYGQLELNKRFESLGLKPNLIITLSEFDANEDHRIVHKSARIQARCYGRSVSLICCEPFGESNQFNSNLYVDISDVFQYKLRAIEEIECELKEFPHPRSVEAVATKAKVRGSECGADFAEAFEVKRWVIT